LWRDVCFSFRNTKPQVMENKKNPKANLNKDSQLYFVIGLALILFITWRALEWKTQEHPYKFESFNIISSDEDEISITKHIKELPPELPLAVDPKDIEIIKNDDDQAEDIFNVTDFDFDDIVDVKHVKVEKIDDTPEVPFIVIEEVPVFPGCEKVKKSERRNCFQEQMNKHIRKNFRYPEIASQLGIQGRVYVNFIIGKDGSISEIKMRGPDKNLEQEALRIISKLPQMTPGKQQGKAVRVLMSIPIYFRLQ
jgi:periplasmic protein TonB